jgi:molybdopterin synthase catalytic subunit
MYCRSCLDEVVSLEACEWAIRELTRTVPIWEKEDFEDGEVWVEPEPPAVAGG